jgi:CheY-like chemotaxis protein
VSHQDHILLISQHHHTDIGLHLGSHLRESFSVTEASAVDCLQTGEHDQAPALIIMHPCCNAEDAAIDLALYSQIKQHDSFKSLPLIAITACDSLQEKLTAFNAGCDDVFDCDTPIAEIVLRLQKAIFHKRCNNQLKSQVQLANQMAFSAMADTSNLGINIQFLLESAKCSNLDELGMLFFSTIESYGLRCSLQLRSEYAVKSMEANGMTKELEEQLLTQLSGVGRYYDFGSRTVSNYGRASVLIKNMPLDNPERYGAIKDNTFALLQGLDARIQSLDTSQRLSDERESLRNVSLQVKQVMVSIDESYQVVMRQIAEAVEEMATQIDKAIPVLALSEEQEKFIETVAHGCVLRTNQVFNDGLQVDRTFHRLMQHLDNVMGSATSPPPST